MTDSHEVLSEDELEALAEGVASGEVQVETDHGQGSAGVATYNFHQPGHLLKARLPALDLVNERFCKEYQVSLFNFLHRMLEIEQEELQMLKFADYLNSLPVASNVNRARINELNGSMLFCLDSDLVYILVDCFFGGPGIPPNQSEKREYSVMEKRIIERILNLVFQDLTKAWAPVSKMSFEYMHMENKSQMSGLAESNEIVVLSKLKFKLYETECEMHMVIPYALLEPLRPILASGIRKEHVDSDENWRRLLRNSLGDVEVDINSVFIETDISVGELMSLKAGDFVPVNMTETTTVCCEDVPLFEGKIGVSNQAAAVCLTQWHRN
jgi:flagellar motor switch protein FliM